MSAYRSFVVNDNNGAVSSEITIRNSRDLPVGEILIKIKYSSLNYIDALAISGDKTVVSKFPHTPGIDGAGIVVDSSDNNFHVGDEVVVTGYGLGMSIPGGFGEYVRVPASWVVSLPTGLTLKAAMTIGADGLSAAIAAMDIMAAGVLTTDGNAVVSGAMGGIGSFAVAIFAKCGFNVTAVVNDENSTGFLKTIGAKNVVTVDKFVDNTGTDLLADKYALAIDTMGGQVLSTISRSLKKNGVVAICSAMLDKDVSMSLRPFLFRGINMLGIDSVNCHIRLKQEAWYKLAGEWYIKALPMLCNEISLGELESYASRYIKSEIKGRIVVNHEL